MSKSNPLFKPYIGKSVTYIGGKAAHEVKTKAGKIYKLSSNENPIGASPKAVEAIQKVVEELYIYPDRTDRRLCEALSSYYDSSLSPEHFFSANSGSECLEYIIRAFMGEGLECIISSPTFPVYKSFAKWTGGKHINVPLIGDEFRLDIGGIADAINEKTRLIFVTSPNNPTGTYIRKRELKLLLDSIPDHVIVILDEVYYLFADANSFTTAECYVKGGHRIIGLNSFSKSFGLAGLRLGYFYSTAEIVNYIRGMTRPFLINKLAIEAGIAALSDDDFVTKTVETVKKGRAFLYKELDQLGMKYWKSEGNFTMMKPEMEDKIFEEKMIEKGIMVRRVGNFGASGCVRVTVGNQEANEAFIQALESILVGA